MLVKLYYYTRILSLDVVLGSCAMSYFLSYFVSARLPFFCYSILGTTVWLIYTADHLMDAQKISHPAHTSRHLFHQKNFNIIIAIFILALLFSGFQTLQNLSNPTLFTGAILLFIAGLYLVMVRFYGSQNSLYIHKELIVAAVYALGVSIGPLCYMKGDGDKQMAILILQIFFIALVNLILCAFLDLETDMADGHASFVKYLGKKSSLYFVLSIMLLYLVVAVLGCLLFPSETLFLKAQFILAIMLLVLVVLFFIKRPLNQIELLKGIADAIFFLPLIISII